ncbi:MAG: hypothetical protein Greene101449_638 [Candidatus Peregrinibacteria bacterium Greene1014_49]|nr:MAG: hypothetical protein Greene101449_638 [Candidatus Peregrinibacteria bacterium Greene1014_49]
MPRSEVYPEALPFAYKAEELDDLQRKVDQFFSNQQVQKGMRDTKYNLTTVRNAPCPAKYYPKTNRPEGLLTLGDALKKLLSAVNQSQMIRTSRMHERLGLYDSGEEFMNTIQVVDIAELGRPIEDSRKLIRVHCALALEMKEFRCTRKDVAASEDLSATPHGMATDNALKKITHGVCLGYEELQLPLPSDRTRRGYSHGASQQELKEIWSYGEKDLDPRTLQDRIQGMHFRHMKMAEFAEIEREERVKRQYSHLEQWRWHTGNRPAFFSGNQQILENAGPINPHGHTLDFQKIDTADNTLARQIERTIDQIAALLYDYPKE